MITFHFCKAFENKVEELTHEKWIKNKFLEYAKRSNLRNVGTIQAFAGSCFVAKTNTPKTRTIIQEENIDIEGENVRVHFVRELIANKDVDYIFNKVIFPQLKTGEWAKNNPLPEDDIDDFKFQYQSSKLKLSDISRQKPPQHLTAWMEDYKLIIKYDIFETEDWVKYALNDSASEGMRDIDVKTFGFLLDSIVNENDNIVIELLKSDNQIEIHAAYKYDIGIIFSKIHIEEGTVYVLHNGAHIEVQREYWKNAVNQIKNQTPLFELNFESISRTAYRAYPKWTIKNHEKWFAIQKNHEISNLSLTRDQIDFFRKFKLPCYINGQAGSGKSTMLYYLFANAYWYKCMGEIQGEIIFLTENKTLLEHTQKSVFDLLSNNPEFDGLSIEQRTGIDKCFASFKEFLINLLPEEEKENFNDNKYLNFSTFKNLYENSHLPSHIINNYTAEESWFAIITYIYGYDSEKKISANAYQSDVHKKSLQLPKDKFEGIEKNVLPFYERLINDEGYWDKLKIIKYIDENIHIDKKYSVVICDEAQDFCRVELRFILRLSEYLQYDLSDIEQVPVIFAGDPNQTVNPSGFREREMNEMLWSELKPSNFEYDKEESVYNPTFNYRSAQPVVSLANFIQYYRKKSFEIRLVKPQIAKRPEPVLERNFNFFYNYSSILNNTELKENIKDKIKFKIFIVPVDAHEKEEYRKHSAFLSMIENAEIKTAIEAKGAEYQQVILYGFGEYFNEKFKNIDDNTEDEKFKRRYFFNKLYVGITRAQTELIIIDSDASETNFWKKLVDKAEITDNQWRELLHPIRENVITYNPGTVKNLLSSTPEVAFENAKQDKERGIFDNNAARLKVAGSQFFKLGRKDEGYDCLAKAEAIIGNLKDAGDLYLKNNDIENASLAFFKGKLFDDLMSKISTKPKSIKTNIHLIVSQLMKGSKLLQADINVLYKQRYVFRDITKEIAWRNELIATLIKDTETDRETEQQRDLLDVLETIAYESDTELWKIIADIHFKFKYFDKALRIWDKVDMFDTEKYAQTNIEIAIQKKDFESKLVWLGELLKYKQDIKQKTAIELQIIDIYLQTPVNTITNNYYFLHAYSAFLIQKPKDEVLKIGKIVEESFIYEQPNLKKFYIELLQSKRLNTKIAEFLIQRLAKINQKINPKISDWLHTFNEQYSQLAKDNQLIFTAYTTEEIINLSELPDEIWWNPPEHIRNISIFNFRRFSKIELNNLGLFNLVLGDNNVGKTSILEALLFTTEREEYIKRLALSYSERVRLPRFVDDEKNEYFNIPHDFITDFIRKDAENSELSFHLSYKRANWHYTIRKLEPSETPEMYKGLNVFYNFSSLAENQQVNASLLLKTIKPYHSISCPLIPFGKGYDKDLAQVYYDEIDKKKKIREDFLENMRVFIPRIERISANPENGEVSIEEEHFEEAAPLHQYGEGANKLFRILVQLTLQKGKRLLIDEIDAGIHYSHFKEFWKVILSVAKKENVQIFASTHNLECIKYFNEILHENQFAGWQKESRVITLEEVLDAKIEAFTRNFDEFGYELDHQLEIRGGEG